MARQNKSGSPTAGMMAAPIAAAALLWGLNIHAAPTATPPGRAAAPQAAASAVAPVPRSRTLATTTLWIWGLIGGGIRYTPIQVSALHDVTAIAAGLQYVVALRSDGTVWEVGLNGQNAPVTTPVRGLADVTAIAYGLAVKRDGTVWSWPSYGNGDPGHPAARVPGLSNVVSVASGNGFDLALTVAGTVWSWGLTTSYGQIGTGTADNASHPAPAPIHGLGDVVAIAAGYSYGLALKRDGTVWFWGLHNGDLVDRDVPGNVSLHPAHVPGLARVTAIAAGGDFSLALESNGTVWAWGSNALGTLGDGTYQDSMTPVRVAALGGVIAIAAGQFDALAVEQDGSAWGWGQDNYGQLGEGPTNAQSTKGSPVPVPGLTDVVAIAASIGGAALRVVRPVTLVGAGTTALAPLVDDAWAPRFVATHSYVTLTYTSTAPDAAIGRLVDGAISFAASDSLPNPTSADAVHCRGGIATLPVAVGAVAVVYNLPGLRGRIRLTLDALANVYLGRIRDWDDVRLQRLNPTLKLPLRPVVLVSRADQSGDTAMLSAALAAANPPWRARGTTTMPGRGADGSLGVAAAVLRTPGAIGSVDFADAATHHLAVASLLNQAGRFVTPGVGTIEAAANDLAGGLPADLRQALVDAPGVAAYPLAGYMYVDLCARQGGDQSRALLDFLRYAATTGQGAVARHFFAPLPASVQEAVLGEIATLAQPPRPPRPPWCDHVRSRPQPPQCA